MFTRSEAGKLGYEKTQDKLELQRESQRAEAKAAHAAADPHCAFCDAALPYEKRKHKFCNHSCSARASNAGVAHNPRKHDRRTNCLKCEGLISGSGRLYRSQHCSNAHKEDKFAEAFLSNSLGPNASTRAIRKFLIRTLGERCQECDWAIKHSITGCVPLEVNHVDGNAENNRSDNVRLICPDCHALTLNFRNLNKGNGRAARRKLAEVAQG